MLIPNSTMSTQPPCGVIRWGQTGHSDSQRGSNCFHMTTAGISPGPGQTTASSRSELRARATAGVAYKA